MKNHPDIIDEVASIPDSVFEAAKAYKPRHNVIIFEGKPYSKDEFDWFFTKETK